VAAAAPAAQTAAAGVYDPSASHHSPQYSSYCKSTLPQDHFANFNNNRRSENKPQMQEPDCPQSQQITAVSQSQTSPQAPLQVTNPVSSGVGYQYDSGGEEGKSDSTSWKGRPLETGSGDREEESQIQIKPQAAAAAVAAEQL
jgi:hypothetical protein